MSELFSFGAWVRQRRRALDLTRDELAAQVGCSVMTIRRIETDERRPSKQLAARLADFLHIPADERPAFLHVARGELAVDRLPAPAGGLERSVAGAIAPSERDAHPMPLPPFVSAAPSPSGPAAPFVAREKALAELAAALTTARSGPGQILSVIGGAGRGKTMLVQEFARQAQAADAELLVVSGSCNAHTGSGDPYLPFREALTMLSGDVEAKWAGGLISADHAQRLWETMPVTLPALIKHAPDLLGTFVPGTGVCERAATFAERDAPGFKRLVTLAGADAGARVAQQPLLAQYSAVLSAIASERPLILILEDLHWVDAASSDLLFHLCREVSRSR